MPDDAAGGYVSPMKLQVIRKMNRTAPLRPFVLRTAGGESFEVPHPDRIAFSPIDEEVIAFDLQGGFHVLGATKITDVTARRKPHRARAS